MSVRIKYNQEPEFVKPKLEDLNVQEISLDEYKLPNNSVITQAPIPTVEEDTEDESWFNWTLSLSFEGLNTTLNGAEKFFEELNRISNQITQLLKIIRLLSGNVRSASGFLKYAIKRLSKEIKEFVDSLTSLGLYLSLIVPELDKKYEKYVIPTFGGYEEFIKRVNATCLSSNDPDAPKFEEADKVGGVIIAMLGGVSDPEYLSDLMNNFKKLAELFGLPKFFASPAKNFKARAGFFKKGSEKVLGTKLTWEAPDMPVGSFYLYKSDKGISIPIIMEAEDTGQEIKVNLFTEDNPIIKVKYIPGKVLYSYIDFDIEPDKNVFYKMYSVYGENYLEDNPHLKDVKSPIATSTIRVNIPKECIPVSELKKRMNLAINGEILSPFDMEGDWQSATVRRMISKPLDSAYRNLDALSEKLIGLVDTGSDAVSSYLKFYGERVSYLLDIIKKIKKLSLRLSSFTQRGTFMVLRLPIETGGMQGFVDRFNEACNTGETKKPLQQKNKSVEEFLQDAVQVQKNTPISQFRERGIMMGVILLTGLPDISNSNRLKEFVPERDVGTLKSKVEYTEKAVTLLMKMLGLE